MLNMVKCFNLTPLSGATFFAHSDYINISYIPHLTDLNTIDWGRNNCLAIGLGGSVFLWNAGDGSVQQLLELSSETDYISAVSWAGNGKYLAVGTSDATIQVMADSATHFLFFVPNHISQGLVNSGWSLLSFSRNNT